MMTTIMSSEAVWNFQKYVWTTENCNLGRENCISMLLGAEKIAFPYIYISAWPIPL